MGSMSAWSYTAKATFWAPVTRDAFGQVTAWDRREFACTFRTGGRLANDDAGEEFRPRTTIYLEAEDDAAPKRGWKVVTRVASDAAPPADAEKVRTVTQHDPSTHNEGLPDFEVMTG